MERLVDVGGQWVPLVDVSDRRLGEAIDAVACPAIALSLRRVLQALDDPNGVISAFSSFGGRDSWIETPPSGHH